MSHPFISTGPRKLRAPMIARPSKTRRPVRKLAIDTLEGREVPSTVWVSGVPTPRTTEGSGSSAAIELRRDGDLSQPLSVSVSLSGTATHGPDYLGSGASFGAGSDTTTYLFTAGDDGLAEASETIVLQIEPAGTSSGGMTDPMSGGSAPGSYAVGSPASATVYIDDAGSGTGGGTPSSGATVGDKVWHDQNANGQQDPGEPGVGGVLVQVSDGDGVATASGTTGSDGSYLLQFLPDPAKAYRVKVAVPAGYAATTKQAVPVDPGSDSDIDPSGYSDPFTAGPGYSNLNLDAGLVTSSDIGSGSPENDAPVVTAPASKEVYQGGSILFTDLGDPVRVDDIDVGEAPIAVSLSASAGALTLSRTDGLVFTQGDGAADPEVAFTGSLTDVNAALNGLWYVAPAAPEAGVTLTVTANDLGNTGTGGPLTDSETVRIDVVANPAVNLVADTNVDGAMNAADDALEDDTIGKLVFVNSDDDDVNLGRDGQDAGAVAGEDDLAEVKINVPPGFDGMTARLMVIGDPAAVRLWSTSDRSGPLGSVGYYVIGQDTMPRFVYVEGLQIGFVTLRLEVFDPTGAVLFQGGVPAADDLKVRIAEMELDVTDNLSSGDPGDGFWDYMPGYRAASPVLSSGAFSALTPLAPQPLHAIFNGLGTNAGVSRVTGALRRVSAYRGYAENAPDPEDGSINDMDDVSFSATQDKTETNTSNDGGMNADKAWIDFFVRDYAATANFHASVLDAAGKLRGAHARQVVRDGDGDRLQDAWEADQSVAEWEAQYGYTFVDKMKAFSGKGSSDDEPADPDEANGDGGRDLGAHKTKGDSLTVFQEYRGFILDGGGFDGAGQNGHAGGHKRLSPAFKELLVEVDMMPKADVTNMPTAADMKIIMEGAAKGFSDQNAGAGIRAYWVIDEANAAYKTFAGTKDEVNDAIEEWAGEQRNKKHLGEFVHLSFIGGNAAYQGNGGYSVPGVGSVIFTGNLTAPTNAFYSYLVTHELTHTLLDTAGAYGFNDNEHMDDPDPSDPPHGPKDAVYIMHEYAGYGGFPSNPAPNNNILFHAAELAQIDLTSKESVER